MRILFLLILLANVLASALGQGWLGVRPGDENRTVVQELNADKVALGR